MELADCHTLDTVERYNTVAATERKLKEDDKPSTPPGKKVRFESDGVAGFDQGLQIQKN